MNDCYLEFGLFANQNLKGLQTLHQLHTTQENKSQLAGLKPSSKDPTDANKDTAVIH